MIAELKKKGRKPIIRLQQIFTKKWGESEE